MRTGYDQIAQGTAGTMSITGPPGEPTKWGVPIADVAAGMFAATGIVSALYARTANGAGHRVDVCLEDSLLSMLTHHAARHLATGLPVESDHNGHFSIAPYGMFYACDGPVNVCVGNDAQFQRMCAALGLMDLAGDARYRTNAARVLHRVELTRELDKHLAAFTCAELIGRLEQAGVPVGAVRRLDEALADPRIRARDMVMSIAREDFGGGDLEVTNTPVRIDGAAARVRLAPPRLGEHTEPALGDLDRPTSSLDPVATV